MIDSVHREKVFQSLVEDIERNQYHLTVGALGHKVILRVLTNFGRFDLAYRLATQTSYPSWGYWIKRGSTTLWEDWKGEGSLNHVFFGDISAWLYHTVAGIQIEQPGFQRFKVRPAINKELKFASGKVNTPYGMIESSWEKNGSEVLLHVVVPSGTVASIILPEHSDRITVEENAKKKKKPSARITQRGAGKYVFRFTLKN